MTQRAEIIRLMREEFDPNPKGWEGRDWNDNAEEVADKMLALFSTPASTAEPCGLADPSYHDCLNMKEVGGGMDGERYRCAVCGKSYFLDYEEMK